MDRPLRRTMATSLGFTDIIPSIERGARDPPLTAPNQSKSEFQNRWDYRLATGMASEDAEKLQASVGCDPRAHQLDTASLLYFAPFVTNGGGRTCSTQVVSKSFAFPFPKKSSINLSRHSTFVSPSIPWAP